MDLEKKPGISGDNQAGDEGRQLLQDGGRKNLATQTEIPRPTHHHKRVHPPVSSSEAAKICQLLRDTQALIRREFKATQSNFNVFCADYTRKLEEFKQREDERGKAIDTSVSQHASHINYVMENVRKGVCGFEELLVSIKSSVRDVTVILMSLVYVFACTLGLCFIGLAIREIWGAREWIWTNLVLLFRLAGTWAVIAREGWRVFVSPGCWSQSIVEIGVGCFVVAVPILLILRKWVPGEFEFPAPNKQADTKTPPATQAKEGRWWDDENYCEDCGVCHEPAEKKEEQEGRAE